MLSPELHKRLHEMALFQRILWLAMTLAVLLYGAVLLAVVGTGAASPDPAPQRPILVALAVASALGAALYRHRSLGETALRELATRPVDLEAIARDPQTKQIDERELAELRRLSVAEQRLLAVARARFTPLVFTLALNESIALYGLVLGFLETSVPSYLPFAVAAVALNVACYPRPTRFSDETERMAWQPREP